MVFAAAATLHRHRDRFGGTVRFIFQPAEEAEPLGGRRIVDEGLLDDVDAAIGLHIDPFLATGKVAVGPGSYTLASDIFDITLSGRSAHAAQSYKGVDAIAVGCAIVGELQKIVSREVEAFDPLIVSVTGFAGGGAYNIIADTVVIKGTIRSGGEATRGRAQRRLREIAEGMASAHGASARVDILRGEPPVVNDPAMVAVVAAATEAALGAGALQIGPGWTAADDFGFYSERVPAVYFRLGVHDAAAGEAFALHHPRLRLDENALPLGAAVLVRSALGFLAGINPVTASG
jgi:amidohydrolase